MNLRINGQELRFRINKDEFNSLFNKIILKQITYLLNDSFEINIIINNDINTLSLNHKNNMIILYVNESVIIKLRDTNPMNQTFNTTQIINEKYSLKLILEVDFLSYKRIRR